MPRGFENAKEEFGGVFEALIPICHDSILIEIGS
jgi:hypothetical protein